MASFKESPSVSRPVTQTSPPFRQSNSRHHAHSISLSAVNINHRVTRRKSMTSTAASSVAAAAVAAVLNESGNTPAIPASSHHRRGLSSKKGAESTSMGSISMFGSYLARAATGQDHAAGPKHSLASNDENATVYDAHLGKPVSTKQRSRRASEGSHLIKGEGKRVMGELRCDRCGKGYKHSSCLTKHMWEHDPAWAYTSKLLISKHQQVQLLEAATVLVNMNHDSPPSSDGLRTLDSDRSSTSPTVSGISELRDESSSTETTPPPTGEEGTYVSHSGEHNRFSVHGTGTLSRSFQSVPSGSFTSSAPSYSPARSHFRQSSTDTRPSTAETGCLDDDEAGLAAAVELCNFGTPRTGPALMSTDVPPVPPLPARFLDQNVGGNHAISKPSNANGIDVLVSAAKAETASTPTIYHPLTTHPALSYRVSDERDVKMGDANRDPRQRPTDDDDFEALSAAPMDDDDDGVFGRMEE